MDGWLYEKIAQLNDKMDFLIRKLMEAEEKAQEQVKKK